MEPTAEMSTPSTRYLHMNPRIREHDFTEMTVSYERTCSSVSSPRIRIVSPLKKAPTQVRIHINTANCTEGKTEHHSPEKLYIPSIKTGFSFIITLLCFRSQRSGLQHLMSHSSVRLHAAHLMKHHSGSIKYQPVLLVCMCIMSRIIQPLNEQTLRQ